MDLGLYPLVSGSNAMMQSLSVLANNLSNVNTAGYKEDRPEFETYLGRAALSFIPKEPGGLLSAAQSASFPPKPFSLLSSMEGTRTDFSAGSLKETQNPLDLAIEGEGFFTVDTPRGVRYTRQGNFYLSSERTLVSSDGFALLGKKGPIQVPPRQKVVIDAEGRVLGEGGEIDTLKIADFPRPYTLDKEEGTLFVPSKPNVGEPPPGAFQIRQGFLEMSNVDAVQGLVELITLSRSFEAYQKAIDQLIGSNGISAKAAREVGGLG